MEVWSLNRQRQAKKLTEAEVAQLPEWVLATFNAGLNVAVADSTLYATSKEALIGDAFGPDEITWLTDVA